MEKVRKQGTRPVTLWECPLVILNQAQSRYLLVRHWFLSLNTVVAKNTLELWGYFTFLLQTNCQTH
uniref:Uncharacterized protein n=1 Tax=Cannabis sativa TaxID=3483 RepID=A0A803RAZ1_CANSA